MKTCTTILFSIGLATISALGQGTILWDESVNGPFSFDYHNPTQLGTLSFGSNTVSGATEIEPTGPGYFVHEDYFIFTVPNNSSLSAIYIGINKPNVWTWIGDQTFSTDLGFVGNPSNGELLSQWTISSLGSGVYGMYMANHDAQPFTSIANYRLDFFVEAVPEPSTLSLLLAGAGFVGFHSWRKFRFKAK
jgi:hypothetical protein